MQTESGTNSSRHRKKKFKNISRHYKRLQNLPYFKGAAAPKGTAAGVEHISKGTTGSEAHVFRIGIKLPSGSTQVVTKINIFQDPDGRRVKTRKAQQELGILRAEAQCYKFANFMVNNNVCPFFLRSIPHLTTEKKTIKIDSPSLLSAMRVSKPVQAHVLTTETYPVNRVMPLFDFLDDPLNSLNDFEIDVMIFQFAYACACMNHIGWRHNDMHFDNVMALTIRLPTRGAEGEGRRFTYVVPHRGSATKHKKIHFYVPYTRVDIRIFDFDRSVKVPTTSPNVTDGLKKGMKKEFKYLHNIYGRIYDGHYTKNPCVDFVDAMCELRKFYPEHSFLSKMNCSRDQFVGENIINVSHLPSIFFPEKVLESKYFAEFRLPPKKGEPAGENYSHVNLFR